MDSRMPTIRKDDKIFRGKPIETERVVLFRVRGWTLLMDMKRGEFEMSENTYMMHEGRYVQYDLGTGETKLVDCLEPLNLDDQMWYITRAAGWKNLYDVTDKHIGFVRTVPVKGEVVAQAVLV